MLNNCIVEFDIAGEKRGLKFGTLTVRLIMEMRGITSLMDLIVEMSKTENIPFTIDLLFCSAKAWCLTNKKEINFTADDVANWMDEIGMDRAIEIINKAFTPYAAPVKEQKKSRWRILLERIGLFSTGKRLRFQS